MKTFYKEGVFFFLLQNDCEVVVQEVPFQHNGDIVRIQEIWEKGQKENPYLFNGLIARLYSYTPKKLEIQFIEYQLFYAWQKDPEIRKSVLLHPIGVSGCTKYKSQVLLGIRSDRVSYNSGFFELAPSGNIDIESKGDPKEVIQRELYQEAQIERSHISSITIDGLFLDAQSGIWDIACSIHLKDDEVVSIQETEEYNSLVWKKKEALFQEIKKTTTPVISTTKAWCYFILQHTEE